MEQRDTQGPFWGLSLHASRGSEGFHEAPFSGVHGVSCTSAGSVEPVGVDTFEESERVLVIDMD